MRILVIMASFGLLLLTACNTLRVEHVALAPPLAVPADARPSPVMFRGVRNGVPLGTTTVGLSYRNPRCPLVMRRVENYFKPDMFPATAYRQIFRDSLNGEGYDVAGDPDRVFDAEADEERAVYTVNARITDIKMDLCDEKGLLPTTVAAGVVGEAMVQVEWSVFDALRQKNVYKVISRGYGRLEEPNDEGIQLLLEDAFAAAAHNFGTDRPFFDLIFSGIPPAKAPSTYTAPEDEVISKFDAVQVSLPVQHLLTHPAGTKIGAYSGIAVLVQTAIGHGSGFFIDHDGYILTDAHVVGHAAQVRVVSADKKFSLVADVVRVDPVRDVALLRAEDMPADLRPQLLPLRLERPKVGEDVYAIGTPYLTRLQGTVTKGIVSAIRYEEKQKKWFIQSDVFTYPGNSGGPLLDASGNILGLCDLQYKDTAQLTGLTYFTPIADALTALHISVAGHAPLKEDENVQSPE